MDDELGFLGSRTRQRLVARRKRLTAQRDSCEAARSRCASAYRSARRYPRTIWIRQSFVLAREDRSSPLASLITTKGIALQAYLIAVFEAQCRHNAGEQPKNNRPLLATGRYEHGWLDLVASHAASAQPPTTLRDNRLRQLKRALLHLQREHLIELSSAKQRDRFEHFRLLDEGGRLTDRAETILYRVPDPDSRALISDALVPLPVEFFLGGWAHVLSPAETALYLILCCLAQQYPIDHDEHGVFLTGERRIDHYSLSRDAYESHQLLTAYGLIEKLDNPNRRPDGSVYRFKGVTGNPLEPHRFRLKDQALNRNAWRAVTTGMSNYHLLRAIFG